jgi:hypothetical protein
LTRENERSSSTTPHNPVVNIMHPTTLPARADHHRLDGLLESQVLIRDNEAHSDETARLERAQELGPKRSVLGVADAQSEDLATTVHGDPGCHHDGATHDLVVDATLQVGGVMKDVRKGDCAEGSFAKDRYLGVELRADSTHLGLRDAGVDPPGRPPGRRPCESRLRGRKPP